MAKVRRRIAVVSSRALRLLATAVTVVTVVAAVVLLAYVVFVFFHANQRNDIVRGVRESADALAWKFKDLFTPKDTRVRVLVNYGLAALVYLAVGQVVVRLLRRGAD